MSAFEVVSAAGYVLVGLWFFAAARLGFMDSGPEGAWAPLLIGVFWPVVLAFLIGSGLAAWLFGTGDR